MFQVEMMFKVLSEMTSRKEDKLDTTVQRSLSDEWNVAPSRIVEVSPETIFCKVVEQSDSSE